MHLNLWSPPDPADEEFHARISAEAGVDVAALYREDAPRLRRFFGRRTHHAESIPDLVQSAFARLLGLDRHARAVLDEPRAYLTRIAANLLRDEARQAVRRAEAHHVSIDDLEPPAVDPHARLEARDMLRRVDAAMLALPVRTREIFMAHRFEGLTYPNIAARMGISVKTVEKHISLALRGLHRALGPIA